jgi:catechol 2,3-dioxygenase-like lactoylglutathione lyase family enzyme
MAEIVRRRRGTGDREIVVVDTNALSRSQRFYTGRCAARRMRRSVRRHEPPGFFHRIPHCSARSHSRSRFSVVAANAAHGRQPVRGICAEHTAPFSRRRTENVHRPDGFEIQLVAAEPQIGKPISMSFDSRGRLWVAETRTYPVESAADKTPRDTVIHSLGICDGWVAPAKSKRSPAD